MALEVADLIEAPDGFRVLIRHSKTDQEGQGQEIAIPAGGKLRAVEAVRDWLEAAGITSGPVFRPIARGGRMLTEALSDRSVANIVKDYAERAGLDPAEFSCHSLRSGFPTSAAEHCWATHPLQPPPQGEGSIPLRPALSLLTGSAQQPSRDGRQFGEIAGDRDGALGHRGRPVAPGGEDAWQSGAACGGDVVGMVTRHDCLAGVSAGCLQRGEQMSGIGLAHGETVAATDRGKPRCEPQGAQQRACRRRRLVRAHGKPPAFVRQRPQRIDDARIGHGLHRRMRAIVGREFGHRA